jgi:hypothetical protein
MISRLVFLHAVGGGVVMPAAAEAQLAGKVYRCALTLLFFICPWTFLRSVPPDAP